MSLLGFYRPQYLENTPLIIERQRQIVLKEVNRFNRNTGSFSNFLLADVFSKTQFAGFKTQQRIAGERKNSRHNLSFAYTIQSVK